MASKVDYILPEKLTIACVSHLHEDLEALFEKKECDKVVLKASKVKSVDTAGLQLLLAFKQATLEGHIELVWNRPSENLRHAAKILGLQNALEIH